MRTHALRHSGTDASSGLTKCGSIILVDYKKKSLLGWDICKSHLVDSIKKAVRRENAGLAVIPGDLTSILQPLDVSITKNF